MSTHPIPAASDSQRLRDLIASALREPSNVTANGQSSGNIAFVFTPDLTAPEAALFDDLVASSAGTLALEASDYAKIKGELPTLRGFMQAANPNQAQTAAAVKSVVRILRAVLRD